MLPIPMNQAMFALTADEFVYVSDNLLKLRCVFSVAPIEPDYYYILVPLEHTEAVSRILMAARASLDAWHK